MFNLVGLYTLVNKEVSRIFRIWKQTLLPSVITSVLYFVVFGVFLGNRISDIGGVPYIKFILPGLVLMSVITASYSNTVSSFFGARYQKSIEELLVSPLPKSYLLVGYSLGGVIRGFIVGILVLLVSVFFTDISIASIQYLFGFLILTATLFSLAGFLNGIFANTFDDVSFVPTFIITPLTYLGGVFYSVSLLPPFWQFINKLNPILYMMNGFRYGFLGISDINVNLSLGILFIINVLLFFLNLYLLRIGYKLKS